MIEYRKITENDLEDVQELYTKFPEFPKPEAYMLPGGGLDGFVGLKNNVLVCACYVYVAGNAPTAWIEWVVGDKDYKEDDKHDIIVGLINHASEFLKENKYMFILAMTTNKTLEKLYAQADFDYTGTQGVELIKTLRWD